MLVLIILLFVFQSFEMKVESIDKKINLIVDGYDVQCDYPPIIDGEDV